jgi:hypothetical protein
MCEINLKTRSRAPTGTEEARAGAIRANTTLQHVLVPRRTLKKRAQELYVRTQPYNTFWCHDGH